MISNTFSTTIGSVTNESISFQCRFCDTQFFNTDILQLRHHVQVFGFFASKAGRRYHASNSYHNLIRDEIVHILKNKAKAACVTKELQITSEGSTEKTKNQKSCGGIMDTQLQLM